MIAIKTTLKEIPNKCTKCKFSSKGSSSQLRYCQMLSYKEIPLVYSEEINRYTHFRPKWCPLFEIKERNNKE